MPNDMVADGHDFSFNRELLLTYDVCGSCEAHAILIILEKRSTKTIENSLGMKDLSKSMKSDIRLEKCKLFY